VPAGDNDQPFTSATGFGTKADCAIMFEDKKRKARRLVER
jgi:hypothetical protein